jgi:gliding motility-associated-like protein
LLRVNNSATGCSDSSYQTVTAIPNCYIAVPSAFTPNGDGKNDYLYPLNAYKTSHLTFRVFNRYGQLIFETHDWTMKWDGTINGTKQPPGTYVWYLDYTDSDTNKKVFLKGTTTLIR